MESNRHDIDNFERFLRDKTDEFRMYPSKRVWYSIYNNMHPGNRLPSVSMSIVLVGFLFLIGYLNTADSSQTNTRNQIAQTTVQQHERVPSSAGLPAKNTAYPTTAQTENIFTQSIGANEAVNSITQHNATVHATPSNTAKRLSPGNRNPLRMGAGKATITITNSIAENVEIEENTTAANDIAALSPIEKTNSSSYTKPGILPSVDDINTIASGSVAFNTNEMTATEAAVVETMPSLNTSVITNPAIQETAIADTKAETADKAAITETAVADKNATAVSSASKNKILSDHKAWIEDFAMYNKPAAKKWAGKLSLQAYITPSVVYRKLKNNAADKQLAGTNNNYNNFNADDVVKHKPSFGLETGLSLQYDMSRRLRIKAGVQLNYTRYNAFAFETNHPIATTLTMNSEDDILTYEVYRTSNYSNLSGFYSTKLHNETYQLSVPIGLDYKLASFTDKISWYAGATAQPTIILFAKSFLISTDRRSYVHDPSLLNRFNLNAGFETYLSYKADGYTLQVGPQYRTQVFTTNTKLYSVEERLQNFGFKVGITKRL